MSVSKVQGRVVAQLSRQNKKLLRQVAGILGRLFPEIARIEMLVAITAL
jgi:hypothetical protein